MTHTVMLDAAELPLGVQQGLEVTVAEPLTVTDTDITVPTAHRPATLDTRKHFVGRQDGRGFLIARTTMRLADQPPRMIGPPEMLGTMHGTIDHTLRLMLPAHEVLAAGTPHRLVSPHRLTRLPLAVHDTHRA
jgi:hypothetical protein